MTNIFLNIFKKKFLLFFIEFFIGRVILTSKFGNQSLLPINKA